VNPYGAPPGSPPHGPPQGAPYGYGPPGAPYAGAPPPGYGAPFRAAPPPKKGMSGCLLALLIGTAAGILVLGTTAWFIYREVGGLLGGMKDLAGIMLEAQSAPGTSELRDAGCDTAMVLDTRRLEEVLVKIDAEVAKKEGRAPKPVDIAKESGAFIQCQVQSGNPPTCEELAKVYVKAARPKDRFMVSASTSSGSGACSLLFEKDGTSLGKAKAPEIPK
jgi:hypothetical protein